MSKRVNGYCSYCGAKNRVGDKAFVRCEYCGHRVYKGILEERKARQARKDEEFENNARHNLIQARKDEGLTLKEVSERIHYSIQAIWKAERGLLYQDDESEASELFFMTLENLYGIPREILRRKGKNANSKDLLR